MTGLQLLNLMLENDVEIKENHVDLIAEFDSAIKEKRVYFIPNGNTIIGFCTWERKNGKGFINKCVIYKEFRSRFSMIEVRKYFRELFKDLDGIYWKSRKRNRICLVK